MEVEVANIEQGWLAQQPEKLSANTSADARKFGRRPQRQLREDLTTSTQHVHGQLTMKQSTMLHRILLAPPSIRSSLIPLHPRTFHLPLYRRYATAPSVAQTSFWLSLVPKPLRKSSPSAAFKQKVRSKEWNPATFFIIIFLLIGSMSIQMIALRNEFAAFSRRADAKIGLLREIIERIQNGEEVDVEGLLGTGDKEREKEWEEGKTA
jgi:Family of unknown function (DUF5321)